MNKKLITAIAIIGVATIIYFLFAESDEDQIRKQLDHLTETIKKESGEKPLVAAQKAKSISDLFTDGCHLEIKAGSLSGKYKRSEIMQRAMMARTYFTYLELEIYDLTVNVTNDANAHIAFTSRLLGTTGDDESTSDTREIEADLQKVDGQWLFSNVAEVEVLTK